MKIYIFLPDFKPLNIVLRYLTNGISGLARFPISFKSSFNGNTYRHVVLGVYYNGRYGALGMSRRSDLMDKPLVFKVQYVYFGTTHFPIIKRPFH